MENLNNNDRIQQLYNQFIEVGIKPTEPEESAWEREFRESGENILNAIGNISTDIKSQFKSFQVSTVDFLKKTAGEGSVDALLGDYDDWMDEKYKEIAELNLKRKSTGEGIVRGVKQGDVSDIVGGVANVFGSLTTTLVPMFLTRGMSLIPQIASPFVTDFNVEKAKTLYGDDPDAMKKLIENDETDFFKPAAMGIVAGLFERAGIKGITKYITQNATKGRGALMLLNTGVREANTELIQYAMENTNKSVAQGNSAAKAAADGFLSINSEEGLESWVQGFVGGTGFGAGGRLINRALRSDTDGQKFVAQSLRDLSKINERKLLPGTTKSEIDALEIESKNIENNLRTYLLDNQKIGNLLDNEQKTELQDLIIEKDKIRNTLKGLKSDFEAGKITQQSYGGRVRGVVNRYSKINERISDIKSSVDITQYETQKQAVEEGAKEAGQKVQEIGKVEKTKLLKEQGYKGQELKSLTDDVAGMYNPKDKTLYLDKETALEVGEINVAGHELLHPVFNKLIGDDAAQGKIVEDFKKQLTQDDLDTMEVEMASRGYGINSGKYNTEYINVFSDSITKNKVKFNDTVYSKIGDVITGLFKGVGFKNISFDSGRGVYNFLKAYHQGLDTGKFDQDVLTILEKTKGMKDKLAGKGQLSRATPLEEINTLVPNTIKTKTDYEGFLDNRRNSAKLFESIYSPGGVINNYIRKRQTSQQEGDKTIENTIDRILNFNPEATRADGSVVGIEGFGEAIFANTRFGKLDARKDLAIENERRKIEGGDMEVAAKVVAQEKADDIIETTKETKPTQVKSDPTKFDGVPKGISLKSKPDKDLNVKDIDKKYTGEVGEQIFNIPSSKITKPANNLTLPEARTIQQFFGKSDNLNRFIKILPEFNVATNITQIGLEKLDVPKDVRGVSLGITKTIQDLFYENYVDPKGEMTTPKGRSKGATSQTPVKRLKPEFRGTITKETLDAVRSKIGITPSGELNVLPKGAERSSIGQSLKGMAKLFSQLTATTLVRKALPKATAKELVPSKAGTRDIQLSVGYNEISNIRDIKTVVKKLGIKDLNNLTIEQVKDKIKKAKLPSTVIKYGNLANFGAKRVALKNKGIKSRAADIASLENFLKENKLKEPNKNQYYYKLNDGTWVKGDKGSKPGTYVQPKAYLDKLTPARGGMFYSAKHDPNYLEIIKEAEKNDAKFNFTKVKRIKIKPGQKLTKKDKIKNKQQEVDNMNNFELWVKALNDAHNKNGLPMEIVSAIILGAYQSTNGIIKIAAPFKYVSDKFEYSSKSKKGPKYVEEHAPPASVIGADIIKAIQSNDVENRLPKIRKNFYQTQLSKKDDALFRAAKLDATLPEGTSVESDLAGAFRMSEAGIDLNTIRNIQTGKTIAEEIGVQLPKGVKMTPELLQTTKEVVRKIVKDGEKPSKLIKEIQAESKLVNQFSRARKLNVKDFNFLKENMTTEEQVKMLDVYDKAMEVSRDPNASEKGISVFDFDQTLANTTENVIVNMLDGTSKEITAAEFANTASDLEAEGATFDFSQFENVKGATKGPFFELAQKINDKFGSKDIFVLTARPQSADVAIHAYLKGVGLEIPIENITGLEDGRPESKANFVVQKVADGYNNFFFGDDAYKNVKAVQKVLDIVDVKRDVQQAKIQFSKSASNEFNKILEQTAGMKAEARFSDAAAKTRGAKSLPWYKRWFIPPSAEDFTGLLYHFVGKGKQGEAQMKFFKDKLIDPFARAYKNINAAKQLLANEFDTLQKQYPQVKKLFKKDSGYNNFTNEQAIRVYLWDKNGIEIPGISKKDLKNLTKIVKDNADMKVFADKLGSITKLPDGYIAPSDSWTGETIGSDIINVSNKENRAKYMKEFIDNKELIFSKENLNKIQAIYGTDFRSSLEDILWRMENGTNRRTGQSKLVNQWTEWVNNSVGAIMFFNFRSAVLQTISAVNFVNWSDNNPLKAGAAIANFPQYAKDFATLFNSDMLKQRRAGLQTDVNASEMAESVAGSKNKVNAMIAYLLKKGFLPTQIADSFAISSGGATFYRNRINTYKKQGLSDKEAESKAFKDFQEISEVSQQSSRPDLISQQQAGPLGRLILAFQNTPMQYTRLMKKAALDLKNGRGDTKTNISKILYYGAVQNILFSALQNAMFGLMFEDEEDEKVKEKYDKKMSRMLNNMSDTILRGIGVYGAAVSTIKNVALKFIQEEKEGYRADHAYTIIEAINLSPPIGSKIRKVYSATQTYKFNRDEIKEKGLSLDSPAYGAVGNVISAGTNIPTDRVYNIVNNAQAALDKNNAAWQRISVALGWNKWDVGIKDQKDLEKTKKEDKKQNRKNGFGANKGFGKN